MGRRCSLSSLLPQSKVAGIEHNPGEEDCDAASQDYCRAIDNYSAILLSPELPGRRPCPFRHRLELGPGDGGMTYSGAQPTVRPGEHVLTAYQPGIFHQALGHQLRVLDEVAAMAD